MSGTLSQVDILRMKRRTLDIETKRISDKLNSMRVEIKTIDSKIASLISSGKDDGNKSFGTMMV